MFASTLGLGAALVFSVQPMLARAVLPLLGGSPAVWTTCMVFFQTTLLAGYLYAHAIARLAIGVQVAIQALLMAIAAAFLPIMLVGRVTPPMPTVASPTVWLLATLLASAGVPFFVVTTTAPLLQRWFSETGHRHGHDPYYLYGASNVGSLLALVAYPVAIEPYLPLDAQSALWAAGYAALGGLMLLCATMAWRSPRIAAAAAADPAEAHPPLVNWLRWAWLAFIPSSLMLGVTAYLSTDIAPVPLLWIVPLGLYLLSFVVAFARRPIVPHSWTIRALPLEVMGLAVVLGAALLQPILIPLHLLTLFTVAMVCHGELARLRPPVPQLTAFYVATAAGGALGGVFNGLIAPAVFDRITEYPLALVLACLVLPGSTPPSRSTRRHWLWDLAMPAVIGVLAAASFRGGPRWRDSPAGMAAIVVACGLVFLVCWTHRTRPVRFALGIGAALLASGLTAGVNGRVLHQERNFFGVLQVTDDPVSHSHRLFQGRTLHGQQSLDPARRREPLSYYHRSGPIGQVFEEWPARRAGASARVAVVGLGAGSLAAYAEPRERWTFYEIDPAVVRIARDPRDFTFLRDSPARAIDVVTGDARIGLREASAHSYGLIVLDAFNSDAIPVHLLTREALRLYCAKLADGGLVAIHISNRHVDFDPIVATLARDAGLCCRIRHDVTLSAEEQRSGKQKSAWAVLAGRESDLGSLATDPRWQTPRPDGGRVWTDDFSDLGRRLVFLRR